MQKQSPRSGIISASASGLFMALLFSACSRPAAINYHTGFTVLREVDSSRNFDTTSSGNPARHYRPVRIDLFYPSPDLPSEGPLLYGALLDFYGSRMDYSVSPDSCRKLSLELAGFFAGAMHLDSAARLLEYRTAIYKNAKIPEGRFPLIVYAAGMNGGSWENTVLFDSLARKGFLVAAISSVGKFPGFMSEAVDLEEQVGDILFAKTKMKELSFVDTAHIGLLGWSLGGSSAVKAAMLTPDFQCLLSMDGTEIHYYGLEKDWDKQFNEMKKRPPSQPENIRIPYLYLSSDRPARFDSLYIFPQYIRSAENHFLKIKGAAHEDFSSLPTLVKGTDSRLGNIDQGRHALVCGLVLRFFDQHLKPASAADSGFDSWLKDLVKKDPARFSMEYPKKD